MKANKPVLVFDVDGVCLKWFANLPAFLISKGLRADHVIEALESNIFLPLAEIFQQATDEENFAMLDEYNQSEEISSLPAFEECSIDIIKELKKDFHIVALTCIGSTERHHMLRSRNLDEVHGNGAFDEVICIALTESKEEYLKELAEKHEVAFFVDDSARHIYEAHNAGVTAYQYINRMPLERIDEKLNHVCSWTEIHEEALLYLRNKGKKIDLAITRIKEKSPSISILGKVADAPLVTASAA